MSTQLLMRIRYCQYCTYIGVMYCRCEGENKAHGNDDDNDDNKFVIMNTVNKLNK